MKRFGSSLLFLLLIVFAVVLGPNASALDMPTLNQCDNDWGAETLGSCNGCTICSDGCAVASLAMVAQFLRVRDLTVWAEHSETGEERTGLTPGVLDDWLLWKGGYGYCDPEYGCTCPGYCMMWDANLHNILPGLKASNREYNSYGTGISQELYDFIDNALFNYNPVIARVNNFHYVVITSRNGDTYNINDPWNGVKTTLENGELGVYHINYCYSLGGSLVRCIDDPEQRVYWLQNGKLYWVTNMVVVNNMFSILGWAEVNEFNAQNFDPENYPKWPNVPRFISTSSDSDGLLVKRHDDVKVYLIEDGLRRWITSEAVFNDLGYDWNDIIVVSQAILDLIPEGDPITEAADFYLLSGTLTDANSDPVPGYIYAYETGGANLGNQVYSSDGTYEMALFPGNYNVYAYTYTSYPQGSVRIKTQTQNISMTQNSSLNIQAPLYDFYHLSGRVTDINGVGLANVSVQAYDNSRICYSYTKTDSDGTYDALLIADSYSLYFRPPSGSEFIEERIYDIQIYNDTIQDISLTSSERYTLSGTLTDTIGNSKQGWIYANEIGGTNYGNAYSSDGTYQIDLFPGTYRVYGQTYTSYPRGSTYIKGPYQTITISNNTILNIEVPSYDFYHLSGKVTDINDVIQANVNIQAYDSSGICRGYTTTGADGNYELLLIPGTYRLRISAPPATYPPFEIKKLIISGDSVRNIRLSLDYIILYQALAQLASDLDLALDVFDIIDQGTSLRYDIIVQGIKDLLQVILNWQGSEMKATLYEPNGSVYGEYQSGAPPINIEISNPTEGTWKCEITAVDVPYNNYPFALVVGITPNQLPVADPNGPYSGTVDSPIIFDASDSYDPDGNIASYEWDWNNDGTYDESTISSTIGHTWTEPYSGSVALRVRDAEGATHVDAAFVEVIASTLQVTGDLDGDGDVDRDDLNIILAARNTPADGPDDPRDLDDDGMITALDARKLVLLCTRPRCACE